MLRCFGKSCECPASSHRDRREMVRSSKSPHGIITFTKGKNRHGAGASQRLRQTGECSEVPPALCFISAGPE